MINQAADFELHVLDRGVANQERVAIKVTVNGSLASYALLLCFKNDAGGLVPYPDNFLWFGSVSVSSGDWIVVYTGTGTPSVQKTADAKNAYTVFWNKAFTQLADPRVIPVLIELGVGFLPVEPVNVAQLKLSEESKSSP